MYTYDHSMLFSITSFSLFLRSGLQATTYPLRLPVISFLFTVVIVLRISKVSLSSTFAKVFLFLFKRGVRLNRLALSVRVMERECLGVAERMLPYRAKST